MSIRAAAGPLGCVRAGIRWLTGLNLAAIALLLTTAGPTSAIAHTGGFTINFEDPPGTAPAGLNITISATAQAEGGFDQSYFRIFPMAGGESEEQVRDLIFEDMQADGWDVSKSGDNGVITGGSTAPLIAPMRRLFGKTDKTEAKLSLIANASRTEIGPVARFEFQAILPFGGSPLPGTAEVILNGLVASAPLSPGDTSSSAGDKIAAALSDLGLVVTVSGFPPRRVRLDWDDPTNAALLGDTVHVEFAISNGEPGPEIQLVLPFALPAPIPTLSGWGLLLLGALVVISAAVKVARM